jgi:5'-nucleotidase
MGNSCKISKIEKMNKILLNGKLFWLVLTCICALSGCVRKKTIVIYHIGDVRGFYTAGESAGGYGALKQVLKAERNRYILLSTGNWFLGTPMGIYKKGQSSVELMNLAGVRASSLGSLDFSFGAKHLKKIVKKARFKLLGANIYHKKRKKPADFILPYTIEEINGIKIGIYRLTARHLDSHILNRNLGNLQIKNEVPIARKVVKELKNKGVDFIIALAQVGLDSGKFATDKDAKALAGQVDGIDLIISGGNDAKTQTPVKINDTLIVQPGIGLTHTGRLELEINSFTGRPIGFNYKLISLDEPRFKWDEEMLAFTNFLKRQVDKNFNRTIGYAQETISHRTGGSDLGNWVCDCLRRWAKVSAVILTSDNLKGSIKQGKVTHKTLYEIFPVDANVILVKIKGTDLKRALEKSLLHPPERLQISGMKVYFNPSGQADEKIEKIYIDEKPLEHDKIYRIAVSDNMLYGGDFYYSSEFANTHEGIRSKLLWCIWKEKNLKNPPGQRWIEVKND